MKRREWAMYPLDTAILFAIVYGAVRCLESSLEASYESIGHAPLFLWCLALVGGLCALLRLKRTWIPILGYVLLLLFGCYVLHRTHPGMLGGEFRYLGAVLCNRLARVPLIGDFIPTKENLNSISLSTVFMLLSAVLALLVCISVVCKRALTPCILWSLAFLLPCYFVTNSPPETAYLLLLLAGLLVLCFSHFTRKYLPEECVRSTWFALVPTVLLLTLALLLFPQKNFTPPMDLETMTDKLANFGESLSDLFTLPGGTATVKHVDVRSLGAKSQSRSTALTVTVGDEPDGYLYLRGLVFENFDGDGWDVRSSSVSDAQLLNPGVKSDRRTEITIRAKSLYEELYTPYYLDPPGYTTVFDYYVPNTTGQAQNDTFQIYLSVPDYPAASDAERLAMLRADAYENCLSLDDETQSALYALAVREGILTAASKTALAEQIVAYVRGCTFYNLRPNAQCPAEANFCEWFLTSAEDGGYCKHFATAATALLRAVGMPARYVEGYITLAHAGQTVEVTGQQAHAWVEVFLDESGWVCFDPTPAGGVASTADPSAAVDETAESETSASEGEVEESTQPSESEASDETDVSRPSEAAAPNVPENHSTSAPLPAWVWVLFGCAGLVLSLWLLRVLRRQRRRRKRSQAVGNAQALLDWAHYERLCRACGQKPDAALEALANKAYFSQHTLLAQEASALARAAVAQESDVRKLPLPKRWWYVYWLL